MQDISQSEKEILEFWKKDKTYEKSKIKNVRGKKFYFMDGPPYATGSIHLGTALNKILKDIAMRSKRLQGHDVFDRPGYDTHGVPIEFQIEKEIGTKNKQDIEKFGVKKFVDRCKEYATKYIGVMNDEFKNLGVWMDWDNPYLTLSDEYVEAIWQAFKSAEEKKLLYLGAYPVHVCPRCETAVAYNEIEYGKQKDTSVFVKFKLKKKENTFLIIWTTTPWTLPANTGVMVHPDIVYQEIEVMEGEKWIVAKELVPKLMSLLERGFTIKNEYNGKKMNGWEYESPLQKNINLNLENAYRVVLSSRYVTTEEGSGLVHTAPGHGKEDYEVGKENNLPAPCPVGTDGILTEAAGKYSGKRARIVDKEIIEDLEKENALVYKYGYEHDYPLCWRDKSPLLMVSIPQWFLKISEIQKKLLKENEKTNWVPKFMQSRMKAWLEGISDWPVSRQRYWGTPLPIWISEDGDRIVPGSIEELKKLSGEKNIDVHKPGIDKITIKKNGKEYKRVSEVLDVWFDSGVSSWAALPKKDFKKYWPADLNIEGKDQFRGWWNSQMILSEITHNKKPFNNIVVHGMVLDVGKNKMSKSKNNATPPDEVIKKFGRDYLRYYFAKFSKGEDFSYDEKEFNEIRKFTTILVNINTFVNSLEKKKSKIKIEDQWILSRYNSFLSEITEAYNSFKYPEVIKILESFVLELSRNYIQLIRERADEVYETLNEIMEGILKVLAPIMPFLTERIWMESKGQSIHLSEWSKSNSKKINKKLEEDFLLVGKIIELGLAKRDEAKIGLRWPLANIEISCKEKLRDEIKEIISRQLNVKSVSLKNSEKEISVELDTKMTQELEGEGFAREIARKVQAERKNAGLKKGDLISLKLECNEELREILEIWKEFLKDRTNSEIIEIKSGFSSGSEKSIATIKKQKVAIFFDKL